MKICRTYFDNISIKDKRLILGNIVKKEIEEVRHCRLPDMYWNVDDGRILVCYVQLSK